MRVATPETTAFDLVRYPSGSGYLSNAATVLCELAVRFTADALIAVASLVRLPDVQRLGYLLDAVGHGDIAAPLFKWLVPRQPRVVPLLPGGEHADVIPDHRWRVLPNVEIEADI
jgi:hypothetical protein